MSTNMKNVFLRSFSALLVFITVFGMLAGLSMLPVLAADTDNSGTGGKKDTTDLTAEEIYKDKYLNGIEYKDGNEVKVDFSTPENKLKDMVLYTSKGDFELYVDAITGEIAVKDKSTGDILFSNPYDVSSSTASEPIKMQLMSQVYIKYTENGSSKEYYSFKDSALLGQIDVKPLRDGICIEYSIGEEESRTLVPRLIEKSSFENNILNVMAAAMEDGEQSKKWQRTRAFYNLFDPNDESQPSALIQKMYQDYPITAEVGSDGKGIAVYAFDENAPRREIKLIESYIKEYCPEYTYEQLDKDHALTKYEATNLAPANFRMALEYYLNENGLEVRFPANSLRFDESNFQLTTISILQYMGAGANEYEGYSMIPDGAGALIRFEDVETPKNFTGKLYGQDYAYQEIGNANQEVYRMPVYGVVKSNVLQAGVGTVTTPADSAKDGNTEETTPGEGEPEQTVPEKVYDKYASGYIAIITEGDALANITSTHGGKSGIHKYNSCYPSFYPRPKDSYNLAEAISIGSNTTYTVVSERKYTGSYRIQYIMLTDPENKETRNPDRNYYETSYVGMAKAYRDYLENKGKITKLDSTKVEENIPFFIESFGTTETDETILSIPVTVKKALTSFENLQTMAKELRGELESEFYSSKEEYCRIEGITEEEYDEKGIDYSTVRKKTSTISNLNFRLTGFTNGGMRSTVPTKVKFEKAAGGNNGYKSFLEYAAQNGIGVYPEFDFVYMTESSLFDGFSYKSDAVKTIDNRYISKRSYDAVLQTFTVDGKICISASVFRDYFDSFQKSMKKILGDNLTTGISVGTLGSDLNSDFDEDEPYNREDMRNYTEEMLAQISGSYGSVMIDSGNAYAIPYADILLNVSLDSSRYLSASESIPFFGMVYHGFVEFAGTPTNMAGDVNYELLKIIENGATLYMMLSYDNIQLLKEDPVLSKYYAISYDIWKDALLSEYDQNGNLAEEGIYDKLNNAMKDVQTSLIDDHKFLVANRELSAQEENAIEEDATTRYNADVAALDAKIQNCTDKLNDLKKLEEMYAALYPNDKAAYDKALKEAMAIYGIDNEEDINEAKQGYETAKAELKLDNYRAEERAKINTVVDDGSVVFVMYDNGHWFVLNYNDFAVAVVSPVNGETVSVGAKSYFDSNANA